MSWKNTDPIDVWRTSSTLPIPEPTAVGEPAQHNANFSPKFADVRTRLWVSVNEMSPAQRAQFFKKLISVWPYRWEARAIKWPSNAIPAAGMISTSYICAKVTADVFLVDPHQSWWRAAFSCPSKAPFVLMPAMTLLSQIVCWNLLYKPFVEQEGYVTDKNLTARAISIALGTGVFIPLFSVPPSAYAALYNYEVKHGGRNGLPEALFDLLGMTYESTRSVWRRLPILIGMNAGVALLSMWAMVWGRDRLHNTMDMDPGLIRQLIANADAKLETRKNLLGRGLDWLKSAWNDTMGQTPIGQLDNPQPITKVSLLTEKAVDRKNAPRGRADEWKRSINELDRREREYYDEEEE